MTKKLRLETKHGALLHESTRPFCGAEDIPVVMWGWRVFHHVSDQVEGEPGHEVSVATYRECVALALPVGG